MVVRRNGCAGPLGLIGAAFSCLTVAVCVGGIFILIFGIFRDSDVANEALARAQANAQVTEALGSPLAFGWWSTGSLSYTDDSGDADLTMAITGPRGSGRLVIRAYRESGEWSYTQLDVVLDGTDQRIDLLRE